MPDYQLLGLGNIASVVIKVDINTWGNELCVNCLYDPLGSRQPFKLIFSDTREIKWNVHNTDDLEDAIVALTGFILGDGKHRKPAILTTDVFELFVLYETLSVQIGSEIREISRFP
jgi:hypothetical protein